MVIVRVAPLHVGVKAVIGRTAFILLPQPPLRGLVPFADALGGLFARLDEARKAGDGRRAGFGTVFDSGGKAPLSAAI